MVQGLSCFAVLQTTFQHLWLILNIKVIASCRRAVPQGLGKSWPRCGREHTLASATFPQMGGMSVLWKPGNYYIKKKPMISGINNV